MNNLAPTFQSLFGSAWQQLPPALQKRYGNRPSSQDITTVQGKMDIQFSKTMACFLPVFRLFRVLVPYEGHAVPVTVDFRSQNDSHAVYLDRMFYFQGKQPYPFHSCMHVINDHEVIEYMTFGIGWRIHYFYDGKKVVMQHKGYVWRLFGFTIPLPLEIIIGKGYAQEEVIDDNTYRVTMILSHRWLGTLYRYAGDFSFTRLPS